MTAPFNPDGASGDDGNGSGSDFAARTTTWTGTNKSSAAAVVEGALQSLLPDLQIRAAVEEALQEIVLDVEIARNLQDQVAKHLVIQKLRDEIEQQKQVLDERTALDAERRDAESALADQLVRELWELSREMGELRAVRARHQDLLMQHDEVVAQLLQAQEELADAQDRRANSSSSSSNNNNNSANAAASSGQENRGGSLPAVERVAAAASLPPPAVVAGEQAAGGAPAIKKDATGIVVKPDSPEPAAVPFESLPPDMQSIAKPREDLAPLAEEPPVVSAGAPLSPLEGPAEDKQAATSLGVSSAVTAAAAAVVVALEEEEEPEAPKLEEFEESILMLIFSYLDALDILNTAQVNISMYSRVDTLFFGNANDANADDSSTIGTNEATAISTADRSVPTTAASTVASAAQQQAPATPKASPSSSAAVKSPPPPAPSSAAAHSPTVVKLPPPASPAKPASTAASSGPAAAPAPAASAASVLTPTPPASAASASSASAPASTASSPSRAAATGLSLFSSILQPRLPGAAATAVATATSATAATTRPSVPTGTIVGASSGSASGATTTSGLLVPHRRSASVDATAAYGHPSQPSQQQQQQPQPMNAAMANSMAAKLSDAELNAIIVMTERLKSREQLADRLRRENDELRARLEGAEALREYLIGKVRDMERSLSSTEEQDAKTALQIASDQEVIAFLDARVQELEAEARARAKELDESAAQRKQLKADTDQKVKVLSDMLQFERERIKENEVEWKATRKVLVKEVKSLRAQMAALTAERDGYREQNEQLRRAVVSSTSFSHSTASPSRLRQGSFS
jgi:hypothetical protein